MSKTQSEWLPIYVRRSLHEKLKSVAALKGKKLRDMCEEKLLPLVKHVGTNGKAGK